MCLHLTFMCLQIPPTFTGGEQQEVYVIRRGFLFLLNCPWMSYMIAINWLVPHRRLLQMCGSKQVEILGCIQAGYSGNSINIEAFQL